jgi:alpha-tubulin suppressor-like RCC1 family protein
MPSFFIDVNGYLFGRGKNVYGQLGLGHLEYVDIFTKICDNKFASVSNSDFHTMAIDEDGYLWGCGIGSSGQLGIRNAGERHKLEKLLINKRVAMVSCGLFHTMIIDEEGFLWTCGSNFYGQLGLGPDVDAESDVYEFTKVSHNNRFIMVSCRELHTMAIDKNGLLWACGLNDQGQLGLCHYENVDILNEVRINERPVMVNCTEGHTVVITDTGNLWTCGNNEHGQLGLGGKENRNTLEKVTTNQKFMMVSCGSTNTAAIDENGNLWHCGFMKSIEPGIDTFETFPVDKRFRMISCRAFKMNAIDEEGFLWMCGSNVVDQCGRIEKQYAPKILTNQIQITKRGFNTKGAQNRSHLVLSEH